MMVLQRFLKLNLWKEGFQSFLRMQPSETKVFKDFPKVVTFVSNGGSSTMFRPRIGQTLEEV